jgi:hypothetical protein
MEDYEAAFVQRVLDVETLHKAGRRLAAMHFGGITIECLLKYLIMTSLPQPAKKEWKTESNDPGHTIKNPGHDYQQALKCYNRLSSRVQQSPYVLKWLREVETPQGHFIDIRYIGEEPDESTYKLWWKSYQSLLRWLQKNGTKG